MKNPKKKAPSNAFYPPGTKMVLNNMHNLNTAVTVVQWNYQIDDYYRERAMGHMAKALVRKDITGKELVVNKFELTPVNPSEKEPNEDALIAKAKKPGNNIRTMARFQQTAHDWGLYRLSAVISDWMRRVGATQAEMERYWKKGNPGQLEEAEQVFEDFHGFPPSGHTDIAEREVYRDELAQLGSLEELEVLLPGSGKKAVPISFTHHTKLCVTPDRKQLYLVGGDQELPIDELIECGLITEEEAAKDFVTVGECFSITYDAKKTHLVGPKKSVPYIHQFGEEGGSLPVLVYDTLNKACKLAGGSYTVEDVGIKN